MTSPFSDPQQRIAFFQQWFSDTIPHNKALGLKVIGAGKGVTAKKVNKTIAKKTGRGFLHASRPTRVTIAWKAPAASRGGYEHCVVATDRAGNKSRQSCAKVALK